MLNMHDVITSAEAAKLLQVSRTHVNRLAATGKLPARKLPGLTGAYLIDRAAVEEMAGATC